MITFNTIDVPMPVLDFARLRSWIDLVVSKQGRRVGELHYYFCSDDALLDINKSRLNHDFYTDIVTFPLNDCDDIISAEFCISIDRIAENSSDFGRSYDSELHRVIIHGVLHLIGFDDISDDDRKQMREKEEECLKMILNN